MHIQFEDEAQADLENIRSYLEPKNPTACQKVLISIAATIDQLENFPFLGRHGRVDETREISVTKYNFVIVYTLPDEYNIHIHRILYTRQQWPPEDQ